MLRLAKERGELSVVCDQVGSPTYAEDLARELIALAEKRAGGIYHGVNSGAASWHQFACEIVRLSNLQVPVEPITSEEAETRFGIKAKRPAYSVLDCSSLTAATGIAMQPWQEALAEYIEYLRQNPG
jgi:dTDP-4-dehydrorhamnose reductase